MASVSKDRKPKQLRAPLTNLPSIGDTKENRRNPHLFRHAKTYWNELKVRTLTLPSTLLLLYTASALISHVILYNIALDVTIPPPDHSCMHPYPERGPTTYSVATIIENVLYLFIPLAGWIADTKIGRGNAIYISLWFGWIGSLLHSISCCFQYSSCGTLTSVGKYGMSSLALICLLISIALSYANALAYGMDQLMVASSSKIRAFIYWYVWMISIPNIAYCASYSFLSIAKYHIGALTVSTLTFTLFTLSLCLHFHLYHKFENIVINNPYRTVYNVVKYAFQNKYPKNRSAFTYWKNEVPKRIDFAKDKYGGPYTHEEVENVKTFFRILAVLAALSPFLIASDPFINSISDFVNQFKDGNKGLNNYAPFAIWFIGDNIILIVVPLLEFVILPLFPKLEYFLINSLKGLGISMIFLILSILSVFLIDLIGRLMTLGHDQDHIGCFKTWTSGDPIINISYWVLLIPATLAGTADAVLFLCIFEFLCSQAPFGMHGMLIGLFWFLRAFYIDISTAITLAFQYGHADGPSILSCTTWFTLLLGLIAVIGLVVYVPVARWYVLRIRNDDLSLRMAVEKHFEQRLIREVEFLNAKDLDEDSTGVEV